MNIFPRSILFFFVLLQAQVLAGPCDANCSAATRGFVNFLLQLPRKLFALFGSRRSLLEGDEDNHVAPECLEVSFDIGVVVVGHIYAVATPIVAGDQECPTLLFDASWDMVDGEPVNQAQKQVRAVFDEGAKTELDSIRYSFNMSASLDEIVHAYDVAEVQNMPEQPYDIVVNNCAGFIIDLFRQLNIDVEEDEVMIKYTVDELMLTADYIMDLIRSSENIDLLNLDTPSIQNGTIPDRDVVDALVRNYVEYN